MFVRHDVMPNEQGLFTRVGVDWILKRRKCVVASVSDDGMVLKVWYHGAHWKPERYADLLCVAPGLWGPVDAFTACTLARGWKVPEVRNPDGLMTANLNERFIAEIVAATGQAPYWRGERTPIFADIVGSSDVGLLRGYWSFRFYNALNALEDAGLAELTHSNYSKNAIIWTSRARFAPRPLTDDDEQALASIAA